MPRRTEDATALAVLPPAALAMSDEMRDSLLAAQAEGIETPPKLPKLKVMPAAAGLFEWEDTNDTARVVEAVILGSHSANVLWDKAFGQGEEGEGPACGARDGKAGVPRDGFYHETLQRVARSEDRVACSTCAYNQWESATLIGKNGKGKACTNQRVLYLSVVGKVLPYVLNLSPTSITAFDEYLTTLLNSGIPMQAVVTKFEQVRKESGTMKWAVVTFKKVRTLDGEEFGVVMEQRQQFIRLIDPRMTAAAAVPF